VGDIYLLIQLSCLPTKLLDDNKEKNREKLNYFNNHLTNSMYLKNIKTNEYRTEFHVPPCTHPDTPDIQWRLLLNMDERKGRCQALDMPSSFRRSLISVINWVWNLKQTILGGGLPPTTNNVKKN
jgi:hypothetical protein